MCGICGIWGKGDNDTIAAMVTAMHHRGPDDHGVYSDANVGLGMARLAIIDVSLKGHQPMANREQSIWIVYNGELYNFRAERTLLESKGYQFSSTSDTEVVLRLYEHYGDDLDFDLQPKRGFGMPFDVWLKDPLADVLEDTLSASNIRKRGLLDADAVQRVKARFLEGHTSWANPWLLMMLELWCREVLDGEGGCNSNRCSNSYPLAQMGTPPSSSMAQAGSE